jgi:hypothetical protein
MLLIDSHVGSKIQSFENSGLNGVHKNAYVVNTVALRPKKWLLESNRFEVFLVSQIFSQNPCAKNT